MPPVLTTLALDPTKGARRGDVIISCRFSAVEFAEMTPHQIADACADRVRGMVLVWATDNGRKHGETVDEFVKRLRHSAVKDADMSFGHEFASVEAADAS